MPGFCEEQTMVAQRFNGGDALEVLKARRRSIVEAPTVVEDQRLPAPGSMPVLGRVEIKDMRAEFAFRVAVRRDRTAVRRIVPMEEKLERANPEQPTEKILVVFSPQFRDKFLPRLGNVKVVV